MSTRQKNLLTIFLSVLLLLINSCNLDTTGTLTEDNDDGQDFIGEDYLTASLTAYGAPGFVTLAESVTASELNTRAVTGDITAMTIGSADIFAFSYDFTGSNWESPAAETGSGTYSNDSKAILLVDALAFSTEGTDLYDDIQLNNMPDTIDILFFDNAWHCVTVDGVQYGDNDRNGAYQSRINKLSTGEEFQNFDVVFINENLCSEAFLAYYDVSNSSTSIVTSGISDEAGKLAMVNKVNSQVRSIEQYAIFIPMEQKEFDAESTSLEISVSLSNLIEDINGTEVIYSLDSKGSPITYNIDIKEGAVTNWSGDEDEEEIEDNDDADSDDSGSSEGVISDLTIGSADIFSFSYDYTSNQWDSPAADSGSGNTYENDSDAILIIDALSFSETNNNLEDYLQVANMPSRVDIIYFDNQWHNVTVDGVQYGDNDRNGVYSSRNNRLETGETFQAFDIVFVNRNIISQSCLVSIDNDLEIVTEGVTNQSDILTAVEMIHNQVRHIEEYALFIPMDAFDFTPDETGIKIGIRTNNLIHSISDTAVVYELDSNNSPVTYVISVD